MSLVKNIFLFFCIYKMYLISAEGYKNAGVDLLIIKKAGEIWTIMKDIQNGLGVQNISDLVLKEICGIYKTKILTKEQIKKYKMITREIFEKFDNLSKDELPQKKKKKVYAKSDAMTTVIKRCRGEKRSERKIDASRRKLMIPDSEIAECPEQEVKSKLGNTYVKEKIPKEYSVKIYEIDSYFYEH